MKSIMLSVAILVVCTTTAKANFVLGPGDGTSGPGSPQEAGEYQWDDGFAENSIGAGSTNFGWLTQYNITAGAEVVTNVNVVFGTNGLNINGMTATAYVWSDPNGDSNPNDAVVLASATGVVSGAPTAPPQSNNFVNFAVPATNVGPAGTSFFVGVILNNMSLANGANFPAAIDQSGNQTTLGRTWGVFSSVAGGIDAGSLGAAGNNLTDINTIAGLGGRWMVRADAVAIPEPGSAMLLLLGFAGLVGLYRRNR